MEELTTTTGIVALAAATLALVAIVLVTVLAVRLRRIRAAQTAVLGEAGERDLVAYSERLGTGFTQLRDWVEEAHTRLDERMQSAERRMDGCVAYLALVRYDAYGEMSGRQSSSLALLDAHRSGVVISSIHHRDQERVYVKTVRQGDSDLELSPEEHEAIDTALASQPNAAA